MKRFYSKLCMFSPVLKQVPLESGREPLLLAESPCGCRVLRSRPVASKTDKSNYRYPTSRKHGDNIDTTVNTSHAGMRIYINFASKPFIAEPG
jgi:hypothetical protein